MPTLSIIIPAFNEKSSIAKCLQSILDNKTADVTEIIVVDNASTDATASIAARFESVRVIRENKKGTSAARQCGFQNATGEILAYLDADCRANAEWFRTIIEYFSMHPDVVCISGMYSYYDLPRVQSTLIRFVWKLSGILSNRVGGFMVVGGNAAVRRSALEKIGGLNTTIDFYGDDTDFAKRLHAIGKVQFVPQLSVITSGRRWNKEGFWKTATVYIVNYLSEALFSKPFSRSHIDVR